VGSRGGSRVRDPETLPSPSFIKYVGPRFPSPRHNHVPEVATDLGANEKLDRNPATPRKGWVIEAAVSPQIRRWVSCMSCMGTYFRA
jgi:hypothetical protein